MKKLPSYEFKMNLVRTLFKIFICNYLLSFDYLYGQSINQFDHLSGLEIESNERIARSFLYDESTLFYDIDGIGVFAYNAETDMELKIWMCDSLKQYFGSDHISQLNDSILLINLNEGSKDHYIDNDSMLWVRDHFDCFKAVNLYTLDTWLYMKRIKSEYNKLVSWVDFDLKIMEIYYDQSGNTITQKIDTFRDMYKSGENYRGFHFNRDSLYYPYFYFRYESEEIKGRKIISDTNGLWLKEGAKYFNIKPYKMTFYGHIPMGYVSPDISSDGEKVLYVERIKRPWEEWYFKNNTVINNGSLYVLDLLENTETLLMDYLVYKPTFSKNQKYCAYFKIQLPNYETNLLEIYGFHTKRKKVLHLSESFIWYKINLSVK